MEFFTIRTIRLIFNTIENGLCKQQIAIWLDIIDLKFAINNKNKLCVIVKTDLLRYDGQNRNISFYCCNFPFNSVFGFAIKINRPLVTRAMSLS